MFIEPFAIVLAFLPLIGYLLLLGSARVLGRVIVTTGGRDIAALGIAISGFVAAGPAELFFPNAAATVFGPWVWVALITFYALLVSLVALTSPPRLVIYGRTPEELIDPLLFAARQIDPKAEILDGLKVRLPDTAVHFRLEGYHNADHAQVIAFESNVPVRIWEKLFAHFREESEKLPPPKRRHGYVMLMFAVLLSTVLLHQGLQYHEMIVQGFRDWLWR